MPTQLLPDQVEAALVKALTDALEQNVNVHAISEKDIDLDGNLIVSPPAVLPLFEEETLGTTRDNTRQTYDATQRYSILVGDRNLAGTEQERAATLQLVGEVRDALAGLVLVFDDGGKTMPITLTGVQRYQFDSKGTWYAVTCEVEAVAQFTPKG